MTSAFRIGTSGWSYPDPSKGSWNGIFYPPGRVDELLYYSRRFNTVEVNSTFYRPPAPGMVWNWIRKTPADFEFTIKLWQKFTHPFMFKEATGQKPEVTEADVGIFRQVLDPLVKTNKFACLLVQFPPSFQLVQENIDYLSKVLNFFKDYSLAVELRHRSWSDGLSFTRDVLGKYNASLVYIDEPKFYFSIKQEFEPIGPLFYLRMHGRNVEKWFTAKSAHEKYDYLYSSKELDDFVTGLKLIKKMREKVYVYTNNHNEGKAAVNAIMLMFKLGFPVNVTFWKGLIEAYSELKEFPIKTEGETDLFK